MPEKKDKLEWFREHRKATIAGIIILILCAVGVSYKGDSSHEVDNTSSGQSVEPTTQKNEAGFYVFKETEMEAYCQEDHINDIHGYFGNDEITIVKMLDYNKYFNAEYAHTEEKYPIALLSWKGKNKTTNKDINFMCWATKDADGQKRLLLLEIDGDIVRGSLSNIYGEE